MAKAAPRSPSARKARPTRKEKVATVESAARRKALIRHATSLSKVANKALEARRDRVRSKLWDRPKIQKARTERKAVEAWAAGKRRKHNVTATKSAVRDRFPMLRSKSHAPVARKAAALQIKSHRAKNPKVKGIASAAGKGILHFEGSLSKGKLS